MVKLGVEMTFFYSQGAATTVAAGAPTHWTIGFGGADKGPIGVSANMNVDVQMPDNFGSFVTESIQINSFYYNPSGQSDNPMGFSYNVTIRNVGEFATMMNLNIGDFS
jgi:hypothetical protein